MCLGASKCLHYTMSHHVGINGRTEARCAWAGKGELSSGVHPEGSGPHYTFTSCRKMPRTFNPPLDTQMNEMLEGICDVLVRAVNLDLETMEDIADWFSRLSESAGQAGTGQMACVTQAAALVLEKTMAEELRGISPTCWPGAAGQLRHYGDRSNELDDRGVVKRRIITEIARMRHA